MRVALLWLSLTPGKAFEGTEASGTGGAWGKKGHFPKIPTLARTLATLLPSVQIAVWGEGD